MTDTARYADVLLPATTFLEGYDIARGYGPISLRLGQPVIEPVGEARSNADVFGELLRAPRPACRHGDPHGELEEMLDVLAQLPPADRRRTCARSAPRRRRSTAGRSSSRRLAADAGRQGRSVSRGARRRSARRALRLSARSGDAGVSAGADLAGQRAHDQLDARGAAAARSAPADAPRRCRQRAG